MSFAPFAPMPTFSPPFRTMFAPAPRTVRQPQQALLPAAWLRGPQFRTLAEEIMRPPSPHAGRKPPAQWEPTWWDRVQAFLGGTAVRPDPRRYPHSYYWRHYRGQWVPSGRKPLRLTPPRPAHLALLDPEGRILRLGVGGPEGRVKVFTGAELARRIAAGKVARRISDTPSERPVKASQAGRAPAAQALRWWEAFRRQHGLLSTYWAPETQRLVGVRTAGLRVFRPEDLRSNYLSWAQRQRRQEGGKARAPVRQVGQPG